MNNSHPSDAHLSIENHGDIRAGNVVQAQTIENVTLVIGKEKQLAHIVPEAPELFENRERPLQQITEVFNHPTQNSVFITGMPGIGKTDLVTTWAKRHQDQFDTQLYVDMSEYSGVDDAAKEALRHLCLQVAVPPRSLGKTKDELRTQFLMASAQLKVAIIVDGLDDGKDAKLFRPGAGAQPESICIILSSVRTKPRGFQRVELSELSHECGKRILENICGSERINDEPEEVIKLLESCHGFPNLIMINAEELEDDDATSVKDKVLELQRDDDPVMETFEAPYRRLDDRTAHLYRHIAVIPFHTFDEELIAAISGNDVVHARSSLDQLRARYLVNKVGGGRYLIPENAKRHSARHFQRTESAKNHALAIERALAHLLRYLQTADRAITGSRLRVAEPEEDRSVFFTDPDAAFYWLHQNLGVIHAFMIKAGGQQLHDSMWKIAEALWAYYSDVPGVSQAVETYDLAASAAQAVGNPLAMSRMLALKAKSLNDIKEHEAAEQTAIQALELVANPTELLEIRLQASALEFIGRSQQKSGQLASAEGTFTRSRAIAIAHDLQRHGALMLRFLGEVYRAQGRLERAASTMQKAIEEFTSLPEKKPRDVAICQLELGFIHREHGDRDRARNAFLQSAEAAKAAKRPVRRADALIGVADLAASVEEEQQYVRQAIEALTPLRHPQLSVLESRLASLQNSVE